MEQQVLQELQRIESQQGQPSSSPASKAIWGLTEEENKIARLKNGAVPFCRMNPVDLLLNGQATLLRISMITGWQVPEGNLQDILVDQFTKKLTESYASVNPDEFEYAFRSFGIMVKDWGKQVNLSLIHEVMGPYLSCRNHVIAVEGQALVREEDNKAPQEDLSDDAMADWAGHTKREVKAGKCPVDFIPLPVYEWLKKKGKIKMLARRSEYLVRACDYRMGQLVSAVDSDNSHANRTALSDFSIMKSKGEIEGKEIVTIENLAKRMILFDMMKADD